jgi:hypothetical protein
MKVVSSPDITGWKQTCKCFVCSSELEVGADDLRHRIEKKWYSGRDFDDGYYSDYDYWYVDCPMCKKQVAVREGDIPYLLKEKVRERSKVKSK